MTIGLCSGLSVDGPWAVAHEYWLSTWDEASDVQEPFRYLLTEHVYVQLCDSHLMPKVDCCKGAGRCFVRVRSPCFQISGYAGIVCPCDTSSFEVLGQCTQ
jgi:hypothetical protein